MDSKAIEVGRIYKVWHLKSGVDSVGRPFWKFCIPTSTKIGGQTHYYDYIWVTVFGKCEVEDGDYVRILSIDRYLPMLSRDKFGVRTVYRSLYCHAAPVRWEEQKQQIEEEDEEDDTDY